MCGIISDSLTHVTGSRLFVPANSVWRFRYGRFGLRRFGIAPVRAGVPKLGYMYPQGYICLSEGVHLRLAIRENVFKYNFSTCLYLYQ